VTATGIARGTGEGSGKGREPAAEGAWTSLLDAAGSVIGWGRVTVRMAAKRMPPQITKLQTGRLGAVSGLGGGVKNRSLGRTVSNGSV